MIEKVRNYLVLVIIALFAAKLLAELFPILLAFFGGLLAIIVVGDFMFKRVGRF